MSENTRERAAKIQDLLTLCLARAFNQALTNYHGQYWFYYTQKENDPAQKKTVFRTGAEAYTISIFRRL